MPVEDLGTWPDTAEIGGREVLWQPLITMTNDSTSK